MANFKNYGQKGVSSDLQYGKQGGRIKYASNNFFARDKTDNFYLNVHAADPTENSHLTTKRYVDNQILGSVGPGFYGVIFRESEAGGASFKASGIAFDSAFFYLSSGGDGRPILSSLGNTGEANTASNLGTGTGVFAQKSGIDLQFKSLVAGNNVSISATATEITLNANVEAFYGMVVGETDGSPVYGRIRGIKFNSNDFYVEQNSPNTDEVVVNLRASARDPLIRTTIIGTGASQNIGTPIPAHAKVQTVRLKVTQAYSTNATIAIGDGTNTYMSTSENDPELIDTYIAETSGDQEVAGTGQITATVGNGPSAGSAVVTINYLV